MPDDAVQIKADGNSVGSSYAVNGSQLTIELGPTTQVACPPGSLENAYLALLYWQKPGAGVACPGLLRSRSRY